MIETKDRRRFFTHARHYEQLLEFSKTFDADLAIVELKEGNILDLQEFSIAFCSPERTGSSVYEVLERKVKPERTNRQSILSAADKIQEHILETFLIGKTVHLKELRAYFDSYKLTNACFCNHIRKAMMKLNKEGMTTEKVGAGQYRIRNNVLKEIQSISRNMAS